jgi:hypothetical protein
MLPPARDECCSFSSHLGRLRTDRRTRLAAVLVVVGRDVEPGVRDARQLGDGLRQSLEGLISRCRSIV